LRYKPQTKVRLARFISARDTVSSPDDPQFESPAKLVGSTEVSKCQAFETAASVMVMSVIRELAATPDDTRRNSLGGCVRHKWWLGGTKSAAVLLVQHNGWVVFDGCIPFPKMESVNRYVAINRKIIARIACVFAVRTVTFVVLECSCEIALCNGLYLPRRQQVAAY
jgi:hypothetical protein